jgi:NADH-quinone oxidoreductase subunit H
MMDIVVNFLKIAIVFSALMLCVSIMTWVERRLSAVIQYRLGPNRVGPFGLFQPIADGVKFLMKEDIIPAEANTVFYVLAPALAFIPAVCAFADHSKQGRGELPPLPLPLDPGLGARHPGTVTARDAADGWPAA